MRACPPPSTGIATGSPLQCSETASQSESMLLQIPSEVPRASLRSFISVYAKNRIRRGPCGTAATVPMR